MMKLFTDVHMIARKETPRLAWQSKRGVLGSSTDSEPEVEALPGGCSRLEYGRG